MPVEQLKARRRSKKNSFNEYVNRRDKIKKIISNIDSSLDDEVRDVNKKIDACISELKEGLKDISSVSTIGSEMEFTKESDPAQDSYLGTSRFNLESERSRCQRKINELDAEIRRLEEQIRALGGTIYFWE